MGAEFEALDEAPVIVLLLPPEPVAPFEVVEPIEEEAFSVLLAPVAELEESTSVSVLGSLLMVELLSLEAPELGVDVAEPPSELPSVLDVVPLVVADVRLVAEQGTVTGTLMTLEFSETTTVET